MPKWPDKGRYKAKRKDKQLNGRRLSEGRKKKNGKRKVSKMKTKWRVACLNVVLSPTFPRGHFVGQFINGFDLGRLAAH